ncbi:hypothetical protein JR316_0002666 [Psilocybe cubensis]|uniref:DUF6535 domain-containing protein n=2 Tax=Psilocybe cubensis TaxID=181762 RepID=A0A8H7Y5S0_PSICU|nr:hypothetical protein JR316_0002666 [Psilocybe cubensis]KAH9485751.1 hypothetical protein JR316_0002666 [Psilocybe cubensis]
MFRITRRNSESEIYESSREDKRDEAPTTGFSRFSKDARKEPKVWKCGNPQNSEYKFPMPEPSGDHWEKLLAPLLKKDKIQCDSWKEEVQNLLIFAGLFSAVVTAFVVESYKRLQPDPDSDVVNLLSRIAARLDDPGNVTGVAIPTVANFSPSQSAVRLNIFWFLSLVLSLTTVLLGIICLQWLREHQHYQGTTPKQSYAIFHMRAEALEKWHVPQIFTALPLLLQCALVLFFTGIIEFLLSLGSNVAAPVIVVIALTLLFLLATTLLPTLQALPLYLPLKLHKEGSPAQCPYKSPQSQAFRATSTVVLWLWSKFMTVIIYRPIAWARGLLRGYEDDDPPAWIINIEDIRVAWTKKSWIEFDLAWLDVRDNYLTTGQGIHAAPTFPLHVPLYDLIQGLCTSIQEHGVEDSEEFVARVYHCFQEVAQNTHDIHHWQYPYQLHLQALVKRFLKRGVFGYVSDVVHGEDVDLLYDENNLALLNVMMANRNLEEIIPKLEHFHELQLRVLGFITQSPRRLKDEPTGQNFPFVLKFEHPGMEPEWDKDVLIEFSEQWATTLYSFFKGFDTKSASDFILERSFHAHSISRDLIWGVLGRLKYSHEADVDPEDVSDVFVAVAEMIATGLSAFLEDQNTRRPDLLLNAANCFVGYVSGQSWTPSVVFAALAQLAPIKERYTDLSNELEKKGQKKIAYISPVGYSDSDASTVGKGKGVA